MSKRSTPNAASPHENNHILTNQSPFAVREAYKTLRTNVIFSLPGDDCKVLGLTSANRHEGKSTNSINLAIAFSQIDKSVLLIDCDMRLPIIASSLGLPGKPGLSDYLVGSAELCSCIRHIEDPHLDVLVSGSIPPDPTGLLESEYIAGLFKTLRETYDYIIVDLPPINTVTDGAILAKYVDGFLLVIRHNETGKKDILELRRNLDLVDAKIIGALYNGASDEGSGYRKYRKYGRYKYYSNYYYKHSYNRDYK